MKIKTTWLLSQLIAYAMTLSVLYFSANELILHFKGQIDLRKDEGFMELCVMFGVLATIAITSRNIKPFQQLFVHHYGFKTVSYENTVSHPIQILLGMVVFVLFYLFFVLCST